MYSLLRSWSLALAFGVGTAGAAYATDQAPAKKEKPYPLTTCVVSGEKLDAMGKPTIIQYEGREVRFCCADCEKEFRKDPKTFLTKLDDAQKKGAATQPATKPAAEGEKHEGHKHTN